MMNDFIKNHALGVSVVIGTYLFGAITILTIMNSKLYTLEQTAAKTECAQYNPDTGDFEWIDPLDIMLKDIENG